MRERGNWDEGGAEVRVTPGPAGADWVLGIGEILWDLLPDGPRLGGAPFNVIAHLRRLGHGAAFLTAVGEDQLGREALAEMTAAWIDTTLAAVVPAPTGTAGVELDAGGHPTFVIHSPVAYEFVVLDDAATASIRSTPPAAIVFGTLAQRAAATRAATSAALDAAPNALCVYDVNLREGTWSGPLVEALLGDATVLKLNDAEVEVLAPLVGLPVVQDEFAPAIAAGFGLDAVCITRGGSGALLWQAGEIHRVGGIDIVVADTIGAGDAFTAGLVDGLVRGRTPDETLATANALGAYVASCSGAIPAWTPDDLRRLGAVLG